MKRCKQPDGDDESETDTDKKTKKPAMNATQALELLGEAGGSNAQLLLEAAGIATMAAKSQGECRRIDRMLRTKLRMLQKIENKEMYV